MDAWLRYELLRQRAAGTRAAPDSAAAMTSAPGSEASSLAHVAGLPAADLLVASLLLRDGEALPAVRLLQAHEGDTPPALQLSLLAAAQALAEPATLADAAGPWRQTLEQLVRADAKTPVEKDLVATARLRLAAIALREGRDPRELLEGVASDSRLAGEARVMLALHLLEAKDDSGTGEAAALLQRVAGEDPDERRRREALLALGGIALERDEWQRAYLSYAQADSQWQAQHARLATLQAADPTTELWQQWRALALPPGALQVDPAALQQSATELVAACLDLREPTPRRAPLPELQMLWNAATNAPPTVAPPEPSQWLRATAARDGEAQAAADLERALRAADLERDALARRRTYLDLGRDRVDDTTARLVEASARLDSLLARIDAVVAQLTGVRDEHLRQAALRTRSLLEREQLQVAHALFLQHFYVDGPNRERAETLPPGVPTPEQLLQADQLLSGQVAAFVDSFAARVPNLVERSFRDVWEPRLTAGTRDLARRAQLELAWARRLGGAIDSTLAASNDSPQLRDALVAAQSARRRSDAAHAERERVEHEIARVALAGAVAALQQEREGIDYGLAASAHELAVGRGEDPEDASVRTRLRSARTTAVALLDTFLTRYPQSFARGEARFRLADMLLLAAKDDFNDKMATFLAAAQAQGGLDERAMAPFVDYEPALRLYQLIRTEDPDFRHQDAVLFNIGMIQSDAGLIDQAQATLAELVSTHSQSPFCQEAHLRMGDNLFYAKDYVGCVPSFEQAAAGSDPEFTAIALYKLGWARFNEDQFGDAADAFRRLFDLYASGVKVKTTTDLRAEAEDYLIHSLCRAGGAPAFASYFERVGARPYEAQILTGMGGLMRRFSLYEEAAAADEMWLTRYGDQAEALATAQRLVDTYERWNKPDRARAARLAVAPRFIEGSTWFTANVADSLRARGKAFAMGSYRTVALYHHHEARAGKGQEHWQQALDLYHTLLTRWPDEPESPRFQFYAGEAAAQVRDWSGSLAHYAAAAATAADTAGFRADAQWQLVAVTDEWYQATRPQPAGTMSGAHQGAKAAEADVASVGADSLAQRLIQAAVAFAEAQPADARRADVLWRAGTLAYAHGWNDQAAPLLQRFAEQHPADPRAPVAARLRADAFYRQQRYDAAADAYELALSAATSAHNDTLAARIAPIVPLCRLQHAEAIAVSDSTHPGRAAELFAQLAGRHPDFEHADRALYRAGLGYEKAGDIPPAVRAWEDLIAHHPRSEYVQDAHLRIAAAWERDQHPREAAAAYERFAQAYAKDEMADDAMLKAADLWSAAGDEAAAEGVRTRYLEAFPGDFETAMDVLQRRSQNELDQLGATGNIASLLPKQAKGAAPSSSSLAHYLQLAALHPQLAAPGLLARVDFLRAEQGYAKYASARLTQPLTASIAAKQKLLEQVLAAYRACAQRGASPWTQASAHRIGEALVHFGDALLASETPAGMAAEDLAAYRDVLQEQAFQFYDRGEEAWSQLLEQAAAGAHAAAADGAALPTNSRASADLQQTQEWIARTQQRLWPRIAQRFSHLPEVVYPVVSSAASGGAAGSR